ncbi:maleylpyruvate isomerase family mycothiol-dependent enzyme [Kitasatospora cinereorecta]|uniref:Maleylpyruvate isomerase family mycothiol-dependent enzyme n=1 Tax=Kitasatospora cinereorecta TaxID=285560 RepID=A0ABW0VJH7_9ACTN
MSTALWEKVPHHVAYRTTRQTLRELFTAHPGAPGLGVPACPDWRMVDILNHLVSVNRRMVHGTEIPLWEIPSEPSGRRVDELFADWATLDEGTRRRLEEPYKLQHSILVMDAFSHEVDIRNVLGEPVPADHPSYPIALDLLTLGLGLSVRSHGLPALRLETDGASWVSGGGEPAGTVRGHRHDLLRMLTGRRTLEQIYALDWKGEPATWSAAFTWGPFQVPEAATESPFAG